MTERQGDSPRTIVYENWKQLHGELRESVAEAAEQADPQASKKILEQYSVQDGVEYYAWHMEHEGCWRIFCTIQQEPRGSEYLGKYEG